AGRVLDSLTREPLAEATVSLHLDGESVGEVMTEKDGSFRLEIEEEQEQDLEAKEAHLEADAQGHVLRQMKLDEFFALPGERGRVLALDPLGRLVVHVVDGPGQPVSGASIAQISRDDGETEDEHNYLGETDSAGVLEVKNPLSLGEHVVHAVASGEDDQRLQAAESVRLGPGDVARMKLVLRAQPRYFLRGQVVDTSGEPLALVDLRARPVHAGTGVLDRALLVYERTTGIDGTFEFEVSSPDLYQIELRNRLASKDAESSLSASTGRLFAATDPLPSKVVLPGEPVRCVLLDEQGKPVSIRRYSLCAEGRGSHGGGAPANYQELRFLRPPSPFSLRVVMIGQRARGFITLERPEQPCVATEGLRCMAQVVPQRASLLCGR
ncbi:MAG: carboxypeptidase-like regulatory domain-containing protein, partial [Acidobacteriota bacterium]